MSYSRGNLLFLKAVEKRLRAKRVPSAASEAESLVRHFGRFGRLELLTGDRPVSARAREQVARALRKRLAGRPLPHLLGKADFYGLSFFVTRHTLIPRPETELLVQETLSVLGASTGPRAPRVLELGTGSGCISVSLTIARPDCRMTALDVCPKALGVDRKNARVHGVARKISFLKSDFFKAFGAKNKAFWDVIVSNPPYIPVEEMPGLPKEVLQEPLLALSGGRQGLKIIVFLLDRAPFFLKDGGHLLLEIGKGQSGALAKKLAKERVYKNFRFIKDFAGIDRILAVQK